MSHQKLIVVCADAYRKLVEALTLQVNELEETEAIVQTIGNYIVPFAKGVGIFG